MEAHLRIYRDKNKVNDWTIDPNRPTLIGRHPDTQLPFPQDNKMSGRHCIIEKRDNYFYILDQNSTNGTFVNGTRVRVRRLYHGDIIRCGLTEFHFEWESQEADVKDITDHVDAEAKKESAPIDVADLLAEVNEDESPHRIGDYRLLEKVGQGGIGEVYKAEHITSPGIQVAIKILTPAAQQNKVLVERFVREARACIALDHPRLIRVFEVGIHQNRPYFVMEYVQGQPLDKYLKKNGSMSVINSLKVAGHIVHALAYVHSYKIIHRDLKPANILLEDQGHHVKLIDLGLAKMLDQTQLTLSHHIVGTPRYMAPEQMKDPNTIDGRVDVYSMGATLYHMITGMAPYGEIICNDRAALLRYMYNNAPMAMEQVVPDISKDVVELVKKAMAKQRNDRFLTAKDMYIAIYNLIKKLTSSKS